MKARQTLFRFNRMVAVQCVQCIVCHSVLVSLISYFAIYGGAPKSATGARPSSSFAITMLVANTFAYGSHGLNLFVYLVFNNQFRQRSVRLMLQLLSFGLNSRKGRSWLNGDNTRAPEPNEVALVAV